MKTRSILGLSTMESTLPSLLKGLLAAEDT